MKRIVLFFLFVTFSTLSFSQPNKRDTTLYLLFDKGSNPTSTNLSNGTKILSFSNGFYFKIEHTPGYSKVENKIISPEHFYSFRNYHLYRGYPLEFRSINKANSITISYKELKKINVVDIEQLSVFLKSNYKERRPEEYLDSNEIYTEPTPPDPLGSISYWNKIKHIYLVEKSKKNKATVTEVNLNIAIE
jgi:hypothetical protein